MPASSALARAVDARCPWLEVHDIDLIRYDDGSTDAVVHVELASGGRAGHWRVTLPYAAGQACLRDPVGLDEAGWLLSVALGEWEAGAIKRRAERLG